MNGESIGMDKIGEHVPKVQTQQKSRLRSYTMQVRLTLKMMNDAKKMRRNFSMEKIMQKTLNLSHERNII